MWLINEKHDLQGEHPMDWILQLQQITKTATIKGVALLADVRSQYWTPLPAPVKLSFAALVAVVVFALVA
jgi:hypothetical protein